MDERRLLGVFHLPKDWQESVKTRKDDKQKTTKVERNTAQLKITSESERQSKRCSRTSKLNAQTCTLAVVVVVLCGLMLAQF